MNPNRLTHIIIKMAKVKEDSKGSKGKNIYITKEGHRAEHRGGKERKGHRKRREGTERNRTGAVE